MAIKTQIPLAMINNEKQPLASQPIGIDHLTVIDGLDLGPRLVRNHPAAPAHVGGVAACPIPIQGFPCGWEYK